MKRPIIWILTAIAANSVGRGQSPVQPEQLSWTKGESHCFSSATADERRLELLSASRDHDQLSGDYTFTNISEKTPLAPTVSIRGIQLPDGSFWPTAMLEVGDGPKGPWRRVGTSTKVGPEVTLTVPATLMVAGLKVDFAAFKPYLAGGGWGRVTLTSGESAITDLKFLRGP